mmetsp:Transcript_5024/g.12263  ORF Transcript_5024/g.12263 Transcript_5024/m.12263 type:complete len:525 (-) Transcript_5024:38-1612(-)
MVVVDVHRDACHGQVLALHRARRQERAGPAPELVRGVCHGGRRRAVDEWCVLQAPSSTVEGRLRREHVAPVARLREAAGGGGDRPEGADEPADVAGASGLQVEPQCAVRGCVSQKSSSPHEGGEDRVHGGRARGLLVVDRLPLPDHGCRAVVALPRVVPQVLAHLGRGTDGRARLSDAVHGLTSVYDTLPDVHVWVVEGASQIRILRHIPALRLPKRGGLLRLRSPTTMLAMCELLRELERVVGAAVGARPVGERLQHLGRVGRNPARASSGLPRPHARVPTRRAPVLDFAAFRRRGGGQRPVPAAGVALPAPIAKTWLPTTRSEAMRLGHDHCILWARRRLLRHEPCDAGGSAREAHRQREQRRRQRERDRNSVLTGVAGALMPSGRSTEGPALLFVPAVGREISARTAAVLHKPRPSRLRRRPAVWEEGRRAGANGGGKGRVRVDCVVRRGVRAAAVVSAGSAGSADECGRLRGWRRRRAHPCCRWRGPRCRRTGAHWLLLQGHCYHAAQQEGRGCAPDGAL